MAHLDTPPSDTATTGAGSTDFRASEHHEFLTASRQALESANLQLALARLGDTLGQRNRDAYAAFAGSSAMRELARGIKDRTLAELDQHLETLEASVRRNGGQVHFAADAADAREIVLSILKSRGCRSVV